MPVLDTAVNPNRPLRSGVGGRILYSALSQVLRECYGRGMRTISQRELRNDSGQVLRDVEHGEAIVVTRRGVPVARVVPLDAEPLGYRPARRPARFSVADLVYTEDSTEVVLDDLRAER